MKIETIQKAVDYKKAHLNLIHFLLERDLSISVYDTEDDKFTVFKSKNYEKIKKAIKEYQTEIRVYYMSDKWNYQVGWACLIPYNSDDESVRDWSSNSLFNEWEKQFTQLTERLEG